MRVQRALVVVRAADAAARVTKVACARERASGVGAGGVAIAAVRVQRALVVVCARNAAAREARIARTRERAHRVGAHRGRVTVVQAK